MLSILSNYGGSGGIESTLGQAIDNLTKSFNLVHDVTDKFTNHKTKSMLSQVGDNSDPGTWNSDPTDTVIFDADEQRFKTISSGEISNYTQDPNNVTQYHKKK